MATLSIAYLVEKLGGTSAVAELCDVSSQAVSQWKSQNRIPKARLQYLKLLKPKAFEEPRPAEQEAA